MYAFQIMELKPWELDKLEPPTLHEYCKILKEAYDLAERKVDQAANSRYGIGLDDAIIEQAQIKAKFLLINDLIKEKMQELQSKYDECVRKYNTASSAAEFQELMNEFTKMGGYKDSVKYAFNSEMSMALYRGYEN